MKIKLQGLLLVAIFTGLLIGCEINNDDQLLNSEKSGMLTVRITDAPFPISEVAEANIAIDKITIKKAGIEETEDDEEMESDTTSFIVLSEDKDTINLMELSNGVTEVLAEVEIPAGNYSELRMHITGASIKLVYGGEFDLKVPSGNASGLKIKIKPALQIEEGMNGEVLIDFDLSRSFKVIGNEKSKKGIKGFHFSPVVRAVSSTVTSEISGLVKDAAQDTLIENATIYLLSDTGIDTISSAISSEEGFYAFIGIEAGTYSMECTKLGYDTLNVDNVEVKLGFVTEQNLMLTATPPGQ